MATTNKRQVNYGRGKTIKVDEQSLRDEKQGSVAQMLDIVRKKLKDNDYQPPLLPEVAISLSELAGKANVSISEVERTVSRDPTVAARVVSVSNSAFYSRGTPVKSLQRAITRLGLAEVRDVAFQVVAQTKIFKIPGYVDRMRQLFDAGQAAGIISRQICKLMRFESELAYLCGLLHDMGEAIILGIVGDAAKAVGGKLPTGEALELLLEQYHGVTGAHICGMWGLSKTIGDAVRYHHQPEKSPNSTNMATVVAIADVLLGHAGIGVEKKEVDPMQEPLFYKINMTPDQVSEMLEFAEKVRDET